MRATNALVLQAGGPTSVINASLAAVIAGWQSGAGRLYGARHGLQGLTNGDWVELTRLGADELERLAAQPGAALGSGRYNLVDGDVERALGHLRDHEVAHLLLIGGNGTMAAAQRFAHSASWLRVVGIPKTIDNDLAGTFVSPGYGSAARYIAISVRDAGLDLRAMSNFDDVTIVETMGRHAGWLAAASALARGAAGDPPHLILVPEAPIDEDEVLERIGEIHAERGICLVVAAEGTCDRQGNMLAEKLGTGGKDDRGQPVLSLAAGVAAFLAGRVQAELGLRCRQVRPNTTQRSNSSCVSVVDRELARRTGASAVMASRAGHSGVMIGIHRTSDGWECEETAFDRVVGHGHAVPLTMIDVANFDVTPEFLEYVAPIAGPLPPEAILWT